MFCTHCGVALYEHAAFCSACGRPVGSSLGEFKPVRVAYASFWLRLAAVVIDSFVVAIPSLAIVMIAVLAMGLKLPQSDTPMTQVPTPAGVFLIMEGMLLILQ